jgi:hypothetical protein
VDAVTICEGPQHVIVACNDRLIETAGFDPVGLPAREAFCGYESLQRLMDKTYATGRTYYATVDGGAWVSLPYHRDGQVVGVMTGFRLSRVPALPEPRLLVAPAA